MAQILRDKLLASGYDVLMLRDGEDVQLDNVARTVICNNVATAISHCTGTAVTARITTRDAFTSLCRKY